jgi:hypothetical protein
VLQPCHPIIRTSDINIHMHAAISTPVAIYAVHISPMHTALHCTAHCKPIVDTKARLSFANENRGETFPLLDQQARFDIARLQSSLPSFCCVSISTAYLRDCRLLAATAPLATVAAPRMAGQSITRRGVVVWG